MPIRLTLPVSLLVCLAALPAAAADFSTTLTGHALSIQAPCARHVSITPDPFLHGQVRVSGSAQRQEEIDRLILESRDDARIAARETESFRGLCGAIASPTLTLDIRVPAGFPLSVDESGAATYEIGDVAGPLTLDLSGNVRVRAASSTALALDMSGGGALDLARASGAIKLDISGSGDVMFGEIAAPLLSTEMSGSGTVSVASGHVGTVSVDANGSGKVAIGAVTDTAHVEIAGSATVHFARVTGNLERDVSGSGEVTVGQ